MEINFFDNYSIDYIEIYCPMIKPMAYWHIHALGFSNVASRVGDTDLDNSISYLLRSGEISLVFTSTYPSQTRSATKEIQSFIDESYCGVKRLALLVPDVKKAFETAIMNGGIPIKSPTKVQDKDGYIEEASIKLYHNNEILFINRDNYRGMFRPGYSENINSPKGSGKALVSIDHLASEVRINESKYWSEYLANTVGVNLVQNIDRSEDNKTGMLLNVSQSLNKGLTLVIAEPDSYTSVSKVQQNISRFGPGIHHLAFATNDLVDTVTQFSKRGVEFVDFPDTYYDVLRSNDEFKGFNIDEFQRSGILIDKEGDSYLLQKFIKPISDRPFFLYELVQRVNGYNGFALKNINVLKKAEEMQILK